MPSSALKKKKGVRACLVLRDAMKDMADCVGGSGDVFGSKTLIDRLPRGARFVLPQFFFYGYGDHRALHSFPTRRSSDLTQLAGFMSLLDVSIVNVALPSIQRGLG